MGMDIYNDNNARNIDYSNQSRTLGARLKNLAGYEKIRNPNQILGQLVNLLLNTAPT